MSTESEEKTRSESKAEDKLPDYRELEYAILV